MVFACSAITGDDLIGVVVVGEEEEGLLAGAIFVGDDHGDVPDVRERDDWRWP
jgi:hypothetical protein